ncbi:hypothetical protein HAZT_HAZT004197 [Hyalella azteca]|uniref:Potassium channel domain-containing protein n=1 Tax=Hyalella azteca TaxID=294128 RepID=A0A6A0GYD8_HYAAZ|nr:hypothetical protein HAZT_HAZT004197 [Hyalella azteca]
MSGPPNPDTNTPQLFTVTDRLWDITNDMHMLEELEWSEKARETLKDFEKSLVKAIKQDGWDGVESNEPKQWTFAGALFYSIILITTIGESA